MYRIGRTVLQRIAPRSAVIVALAAIYVGAAKLGLSLAYVHPSATPVWPATGISIAALLLFGRWVWPGIFVGAFVANAWVSGSPLPSLGIALGNTLEAVLAAWLVTRFAGGSHAFDRARDIFRFAGLALVSCLVSATLGPTSLCLAGLARWEDFGPICFTWWLGDAAGALLVAPLLLAWLQKPAAIVERRPPLDAVLLFAGVVGSGLLVFGPVPTGDLPLEFLCLPFLVAIAFRFGVREALAANALLSAIAIWGTLSGTGPFVRLNPNESLLLMQSYTGVMVLTTAALAAVVAERRRVAKALALLESAVDNAAEGVVILESGASPSRPHITFTNEGFRKLTGLSASDAVGETLDVLDVSPRDAMVSARRAFAVGQGFEREMTVRRPDGSQYALEIEVMPVPGRGESPYWVAILRDVSERRQHLAALEHQALHDALTGLPNRLLLDDRLDQSIRGAEREGGSFAVLLIDLDRFKDVNDTYGHAAGDALLAQVGPRLRGVLRSVDTIARVGGDEFVVLLPAAGGAENVGRTAEKILESLEAPFAVEGHSTEVSASIGIALYPDHGADGLHLLRAADAAMYMAKRSSSAYSVYSAGEDAFLRKRLVLLEELRRGIDSGELFLAYQPQVDMRTGQVSHVEALVRWRHPERGLVLPDEFISGAERIGLSRKLTDWILETALRQTRQWKAEGLTLPVSVNASIRILRDTSFADRVKGLLGELGLDPELLTLEITESLLAEPLDALSTLQELRASGVRLSIDDFGVGALSLLTLKQLPVEEIKIDRSFVLGMAGQPTDAAVVRSIVDLAHYLGCRVVAEGVESEAAWDRLAELGCDFAQGDYVCPPMEADELAAWFAERRAAARG
jgi:diguanylate cyclase (GGDEF)-like protein/PAS domain S-box-containing protein